MKVRSAKMNEKLKDFGKVKEKIIAQSIKSKMDQSKGNITSRNIGEGAMGLKTDNSSD